jgi:dynein heavy chain
VLNVVVVQQSAGNILEDESAIAALKQSAIKSDEIKVRQLAAKETEAEIDNVRQGYRPIAFSTQVGDVQRIHFYI